MKRNNYIENLKKKRREFTTCMYIGSKLTYKLSETTIYAAFRMFFVYSYAFASFMYHLTETLQCYTKIVTFGRRTIQQIANDLIFNEHIIQMQFNRKYSMIISSIKIHLLFILVNKQILWILINIHNLQLLF